MSVASASTHQERLDAYRACLKQLLGELVAILVSHGVDSDDDTAALVTIMANDGAILFERMMPDMLVYGRGKVYAGFHHDVGKFLAAASTRALVNWFLAFPIGRAVSPAVEVYLTRSLPASPTLTYPATFFAKEEARNYVLNNECPFAKPIAEETVKRLLPATVRAFLTSGLRRDAVQASICAAAMANYVLLVSPFLVCTVISVNPKVASKDIVGSVAPTAFAAGLVDNVIVHATQDWVPVAKRNFKHFGSTREQKANRALFWSALDYRSTGFLAIALLGTGTGNALLHALWIYAKAPHYLPKQLPETLEERRIVAAGIYVNVPCSFEMFKTVIGGYRARIKEFETAEDEEEEEEDEDVSGFFERT